MFAKSVLGLTLLAALGLSAQAMAQQTFGFGQPGAQAPDRSSLDLVGGWTATAVNVNGVSGAATGFNPDGTYLSAVQLANGVIIRDWGYYRFRQTSPTQVQLEIDRRGWVPHQICNRFPNGATNCTAFTPPPATPSILNFTSPDSYQFDGGTAARDPAPILLQQPVPDQVVIAAAAPQPQPFGGPSPAPVMPTMPVMPQLNPYRTPNGPGVAIGEANHAGARAFINGEMRGCSTDQYGRPYACEQ